MEKKVSNTNWLFFYSKKLQFFIRVRRLFRFKTTQKNYSSSEGFEETKTEEEEEEEEMDRDTDDGSFILQRSVKKLHFGDLEEKEIAAMEIKRLARDNLRTRKSLGGLGVIPSLVSMLDSEIGDHRNSAVRALIELANGTYTNKVLMVEAGILTKLSQLVDELDQTRKHEFVILLLSISSLSLTQFPIESGILPFLIEILNSEVTDEAKAACLATLYNLSTMLDNAGPLVSNGTINTLLKLSSNKEASERALATLGNLVVTVGGKNAMDNDPLVPKSLIEIMSWEEKPRCQELAAYILMILAHRSLAQREKMVKSGIVPVLLEVALLGSPLAQKRALRILQWFKNERYMKTGAHSGPQTGRVFTSSPINQRQTMEGRKIIKKMVKQSLNKNMELIMRRASIAGDATKLKALFVSSSSKSLPY